MSKFKLTSKFDPSGDQPKAIKEISNNFLNKVQKKQVLLGVTGSGKTFTMANIIEKLNIPTLVLAHNKTLAGQLYSEFKEFFPKNAVEYFVSYYDYYQPEAYLPATDTYIAKDSSINDEIDKLRNSATRSLMERKDVLVISSVSCIYNLGSPVEYKRQCISLFVGDVILKNDLVKKLVSSQYQYNDVGFSRGCFRYRGDCVEVFAAYEESQAIRIEFFGDEIEAISLFDPLRGKITQNLNKITIYPKSHYVVSDKKRKIAIKSIKEELFFNIKNLEKENKLVEKQRLENRTLRDLEMIEEIGYCQGVENYARHFTLAKPGDPPYTLLDFFQDNFLIIIDESHMTIPQVGAMYLGDRSRKESLVNYGFRLPSALDNRPLKFCEFENKLDKVLYVSATPADYELQQTKGLFVEQIVRPTGLLDPLVEIRNAKNQVDDLLLLSRKTIAKDQRVLIIALTKKLAEELSTYYNSFGMKVGFLHSDIDTIKRMEIIRDLRLGEIDILVGINLLREGLDIPEVSLVAILDADKEGFLRSERSLIQTIGRAARNIDGRVILYAYRKTSSIEKAVSETKRRRNIQKKYNQLNSIVPKTISKDIKNGIIDIIKNSKNKKIKNVNTNINLSQESIEERIKELRIQMKELSRQLRYEEAAEIRDEIKELSSVCLSL